MSARATNETRIVFTITAIARFAANFPLLAIVHQTRRAPPLWEGGSDIYINIPAGAITARFICATCVVVIRSSNSGIE